MCSVPKLTHRELVNHFFYIVILTSKNHFGVLFGGLPFLLSSCDWRDSPPASLCY